MLNAQPCSKAKNLCNNTKDKKLTKLPEKMCFE